MIPSATYASDRKVLTKVKPEYPAIAKRMKITGSVLLSVVVEPSGKVRTANTLMGEWVLMQAAKTAVEKWKFEPGQDVTTEDVELNFPQDSTDPK
jgi:TonB family protein